MAESKTRYWEGTLYPENMIEDWEYLLPETIKLPFAYCIHDKDADKEGELRKAHLHLMLAWNGPTTYSNAFRVFDKLTKPGCKAIHRIEMIDSMRGSYDYLIHDTDDARKRGKYQYPPESRIEGNGFDIGFYEQLSLEEKAELFEQLVDHVIDNGIYNLVDLRCWMKQQGENCQRYKEVARSYSAPLQRYLDAVYQKRIYVTGINKVEHLRKLVDRVDGEAEGAVTDVAAVEGINN